MKATVASLSASRRIDLREQELEPREDEVLVRVRACGICRGDLRAFTREDAFTDAFGHEPVGQVVARGRRARVWSEGDWVAGTVYGAFASHFVASESDLYAAPSELAEAGCLAEPLKCVTTVVRAAAPDFGDTVVVVGCGFMGLGAVAALAGGWQRELIAVDLAAPRRRLALELGAARAMDPAACDVRTEILESTEGRGADVAIEFAGSPEAPAFAAKLLRPRGRLVLGGGQSVRDNVYGSAITIRHAPPAFSPDQADDYRRAIDAMARGRYPVARLISHRFALSEIQQAFETASSDDPDYVKGIVVNDVE